MKTLTIVGLIIVLLDAMAVVWLWPGAPGVLTLGELRLEWIAKVVTCLLVGWSGLGVAGWVVAAK